ncbi:PREDICTED: WPP domain-interacting protein 1-like [Tarenaya hassleriana]|uniref:WPP domain-interacting protein 1-like n=1 Tax=Tarenaya hassleriana TaxID=28532 RepID=UPI00053C8FE9|nr:PREDICTED: WPP domain-interacting protein 1-like [Tarenaya hassleriana]
MDLKSEGSVLESVDDNSVTQQCENAADEGKILSTGPCLDERGKPVSVHSAEADKDDNSLGKTVNFDSSGAKSPGGASPSMKKGYGLRKWRRIRRDVVKDSSANWESNKILKRGLSGSGHSHSKQMHFRSPELEENSQASVGSSLDSRLPAGLTFSAGVDSEISEDRSSKSSTAASAPKARYESDLPTGHSWDKKWAKYLGGKAMIDLGDQRAQRGKSQVENSKKSRGEGVKIKKEKSHSGVESDSRGSNFVFMQGDFCSSSSRKQSWRAMDYNGENSGEAHSNGETSCRKDNAGEEAEELSQEDSSAESIAKNSYFSGDLDPLTESINSFLTLQEALEQEIQKFREIGKEPMTLHHHADNSGSIHATGERTSEASSSHQLVSGKVIQRDSTSSDSQISAFVKNIEYLEVKLEETRSMLEMKESRIRELESMVNLNKFSGEEVESTSASQQEGFRGTEIGVEDAFQQKIEAEIEYMILSRSIENLKTVSDKQMKLFEEQKGLVEEEAHEVMSKLGKAETKAEILRNRARDLEKHCGDIVETREMHKIKKRARRTSSCLLLQLVLLLVVVYLFISQMLPESEIVVPT